MFNKTRHYLLPDATWDAGKAEQTIAAINQEVITQAESGEEWPQHPMQWAIGAVCRAISIWVIFLRLYYPCTEFKSTTCGSSGKPLLEIFSIFSDSGTEIPHSLRNLSTGSNELAHAPFNSGC